MIRLPDAQIEYLAAKLGFDPVAFDDKLDGDIPPAGEVDDGEQLEKQKRKNPRVGSLVEFFESYEQTKKKEGNVCLMKRSWLRSQQVSRAVRPSSARRNRRSQKSPAMRRMTRKRRRRPR